MLVVLNALKMLAIAMVVIGGISLLCYFGVRFSRKWTTPKYNESPGKVVLGLVTAKVFSICLIFAGFTAPKSAWPACGLGIALFFFTMGACPQEKSRR